MPRVSKAMQTLDELQIVMTQQHELKHYARAQTAMEDFLERCVLARQAPDLGEEFRWFDHPTFPSLVTALASSLLVLSKPQLQELLAFQAFQFASQAAQGLGTTEPLARAELTLRDLKLLHLRATSEKYSRTQKLLKWEELIDEAKTELELAVCAWEALRTKTVAGMENPNS